MRAPSRLPLSTPVVDLRRLRFDRLAARWGKRVAEIDAQNRALIEEQRTEETKSRHAVVQAAMERRELDETQRSLAAQRIAAEEAEMVT